MKKNFPTRKMLEQDCKDGISLNEMHKKTLWHHASPLRLTELEYSTQNGYTKVWGKEKYKFVKLL